VTTGPGEMSQHRPAEEPRSSSQEDVRHEPGWTAGSGRSG
jgi:hypothetical protein